MNIYVNLVLWIAYVVSLYFSVFLMLVYLDKRFLFHHEQATRRKSLSEEPHVAIIIPAYNEEKTILQTLQSVEALQYPHDKLEILVVNDGSTDRTEERVREFIKSKRHFRLISQPNQGKAAALNRGLQEITAPFFACLDADSYVDPDTLRKMLSQYSESNDPQLAVITPAMKVHEPGNILQKIQWLEYIVIILFARLASHLDSLYVAPGPFSLYRTEIIRKIGGFDEKNITEDQEIAYRLQQHHYRIKHCFNGYVYTTAPATLKPFYRQRRRWYLGGLACLHQYRKLIANRKYGDFGMLQMVKNVVGYVLAVTGMVIIIYLFLVPFWDKLKSLVLVKFNIIPYILAFKLKITFLNFLLTDFRKGFIILFLFAIGTFLFWQAHRNARERMTRFGLLPLLPYAAFYYLLKGFILLSTLVEFARRKKTKW